jgi:hypothetical protein
VRRRPQILRRNAIRSSRSSPRTPTRPPSSGHHRTTGDEPLGARKREKPARAEGSLGSGSPTTIWSGRGDRASRSKSPERCSQLEQDAVHHQTQGYCFHHGISTEREEGNTTAGEPNRPAVQSHRSTRQLLLAATASQEMPRATTERPTEAPPRRHGRPGARRTQTRHHREGTMALIRRDAAANTAPTISSPRSLDRAEDQP